MKISIPNLSLVVLIGPSGSGKSTFARKHFLPTEVLSSDACRAAVSDDQNNQAVTNDAFEVLHFIAAKRLSLGRLTVIDATNVQPEARKPLVALARQYHCLPVAIVLNLPEKVCHERNRARDERSFGAHVVRQQQSQLRRSLRSLAKEGFRHTFVLESPEEVEAAAVERVPLYNDKRHERGPFDIIGDVHGCCDELEALLLTLGYAITATAPGGPALASGPIYAHPQGRKAVFVGDLVDRGPRILDTVRLLYGETTGETDECGLPVRYNWAAAYRGPAMVVYGHTPVPEPEWLNRTVNIDTGCVFGGKLTAMRYPEKEFVSVPAAHTYCEPARPFTAVADSGGLRHPARHDLTAQQVHDEVLDAEDVLGKRIVTTRLRGSVTIREANATAALEVMSRFAANPKWLIYLPPTMSPCETTSAPGLLEHPAEAFAYYRAQGAPKVVCEEKHMGSRAVVIVCRDQHAAKERFGVAEDEIGIVYTRTGRRFFNEPGLERQFLDRIRAALTTAAFWDNFGTTWACLDCELMPWSAKAQELLRGQYAAVGAAGRASLPRAVAALERAAASLSDNKSQIENLEDMYRRREENVAKFVAAYRQYCWSVASLNDLKLAPFHLLATEGGVHVDKDHVWHMEELAKICRCDSELLLATPYKLVDVTDPASEAEGMDWWTKLTERGGEGMVVKPLSFILRGKRGLAQPAVKCRGREYLRIIYGPDYTTDENLSRLRNRGLGQKRALALGEFALGIEGLERFVRKEPRRRVHECVFGILALESEPVDPRL